MKLTKLLFASAAIGGITIGYIQGATPRGVPVIHCPSDVGHTGVDPCYDMDACAAKLECQKVSNGVWVAIAPSGYYLWQNGPQTDVYCKRVTSDNSNCTGGTSDTFTRPTCGTKVVQSSGK
jgi:hypothetical protein